MRVLITLYFYPKLDSLFNTIQRLESYGGQGTRSGLCSGSLEAAVPAFCSGNDAGGSIRSGPKPFQSYYHRILQRDARTGSCVHVFTV